MGIICRDIIERWKRRNLCIRALRIVKSGRGQPHSKTLARFLMRYSICDVLECGFPPCFRAAGYSVGNFSKIGGAFVREGSSGIISLNVRNGWKGIWTILGTKYTGSSFG
jgi:hypothetical protein